MMTQLTRRQFLGGLAALPLSACATAGPALSPAPSGPPLYPNETPELRRLINRYADLYEVPRPLVHSWRSARAPTPRARATAPISGCCRSCPPRPGRWAIDGPPQELLECRDQPEIRGEIPARRVAAVGWRLRHGDQVVRARLLLRGQAARYAGRDRVCGKAEARLTAAPARGTGGVFRGDNRGRIVFDCPHEERRPFARPRSTAPRVTRPRSGWTALPSWAATVSSAR